MGTSGKSTASSVLPALKSCVFCSPLLQSCELAGRRVAPWEATRAKGAFSMLAAAHGPDAKRTTGADVIGLALVRSVDFINVGCPIKPQTLLPSPLANVQLPSLWTFLDAHCIFCT